MNEPVPPLPGNGGKPPDKKKGGGGSPPSGDPHVSEIIRNEVVSKVAELNPSIKERIVKSKADAILDERYGQVAKALDKLEELEKSFKRFENPDHKVFNSDGTPLHMGFSEQRLKEKKKAEEIIKNLKTAITKALGEADYSLMKDAMEKAQAANKSAKEEKNNRGRG